MKILHITLQLKKKKKKIKYPDCYKKFPSKRGFRVLFFAFVLLREDLILIKDQTSTTDFYSTDVADIRLFLQV